jgi:hypothetical protein
MGENPSGIDKDVSLEDIKSLKCPGMVPIAFIPFLWVIFKGVHRVALSLEQKLKLYTQEKHPCRSHSTLI